MKHLEIRPAKPGDLEAIEEIYAGARQFMAQNGNPTQWTDGYPQRELLEADLRLKQLYVVEENGKLCGVFVFAMGEDPTYGYLEGGTWRSEKPYGTIHRIASCGSGVFDACLDFCRSRCDHIRLDTHAQNAPMQHLAQKHGFSRRGIIYVLDGTPRIAFDLILP